MPAATKSYSHLMPLLQLSPLWITDRDCFGSGNVQVLLGIMYGNHKLFGDHCGDCSSETNALAHTWRTFGFWGLLFGA